jgi:hypothetical protein
MSLGSQDACHDHDTVRKETWGYLGINSPQPVLTVRSASQQGWCHG